MTGLQPLVHKAVHLIAEGEGTDQSARFFRLRFTVPEGCIHLQITLQPDSDLPVQLPLCLFDPCGDVRIMKAGARVTREAVTFDLRETEACHGGVPGRIHPGEWKLVIYKRRMPHDVDATITVSCTVGESLPTLNTPALTFAQALLDPQPGWYQGELHTHSNESTGRTSVAEVVDAARACDLDFLALTDHFTATHWRALQSAYDGQKPLLMQSMEVSGDRGHANLHGLHRWMNPLVDDNEELTRFLDLPSRPSMEQLADDTHREGGLVCINHPLSGEMGWRYHAFDLHKADLLEVWCTSEMDATLPYPTFYDMLLMQGYRLTAVGSSDSHHPTRPGPWQLGQVRTCIYADELSQPALLRGLKAGHAYVSVNRCEMALTAHCGDHAAMMGDTLPCPVGNAIQVAVELKRHPTGNLFLYMDGQILETRYVAHDQPETLLFALPDDARKHRYIRVEFYEVEGELPYYGYSWRNWQTLRLISNPIYFSKGV